MSHVRVCRAHPGSRGVASLAVTLIMLALSALVVLYVNRGAIFEQRMSANQARATSAFEVAEAGVEWAIARLNDTTAILPSATSTCGSSTGSNVGTFRSFYLLPSQDPTNPSVRTYSPPANSRAACSLDETTGALSCHCPVAGQTPSASGTRNFAVTFARAAGVDEPSILITSRGCINSSSAECGAAGSTSDATARVSVVVRAVSGMPTPPFAAITGSGYVQVCGSFNVSNTNRASGGFLVTSGLPTQVGNGAYESGALTGAQNCGGSTTSERAIELQTIAGAAPSSKIAPNDGVLANAGSTTDSMMVKYFGMTLAQYTAPPTCTVTSGAALVAAYSRSENPCTRFWIDGALDLSASLGTVQRPVMIAARSLVNLPSGGNEIRGLIYSDSSWTNNGSGSAKIIGALIVRGNLYANGDGSVNFNQDVLANIGQGSDFFVRVPGTWTDSDN